MLAALYRYRTMRWLSLASRNPKVLLLLLLLVGVYRWMADFHRGVEMYDAPDFDHDALAESTVSAMLSTSSIHVLLASDDSDLRSAAVAIRSAFDSAAAPERLVFHFLTTPDLAPVVQDLFREHIAFTKVLVHHDLALQERMEDLQSRTLPGNVQRALALDMAPLFVQEVLGAASTGIHRVIYLRTDVVVLGDLGEVYRAEFGGHAIATLSGCARHMQDIINFSAMRETDASPPLAPGDCAPSDGLLVIDLPAWRRAKISDRVLHWASVNRDARSPLWPGGASLPALALAVRGQFGELGSEWAPCGELARAATTEQEFIASKKAGLARSSLRALDSAHLGRPRVVSCSRTAKLLHFDGDDKPWLLDPEDTKSVPACAVPTSLSLFAWGWSVVVHILCQGMPFVLCADIWSSFISPEASCALTDLEKEWRHDEAEWRRRRKQLERDLGLVGG